MEEDEATPSSLPPWVKLEYSHMKILAGATAHILFTNLSQSSCSSLREELSSLSGQVASHEVYTQSILELLKGQEIPLFKVCLLDPKAPRQLEPEDGLEFEWFLFGGILGIPLSPPGHDRVLTARSGDDPPRDRTSQLRQLGFPTRHLGPVQMTTDTALGVTKRVIGDKVPLEDIPYVFAYVMARTLGGLSLIPQTFPTIKFNAKESVEMPFKYIVDRLGGEPLLPPGMKELLYEDLNKGFDF